MQLERWFAALTVNAVVAAAVAAGIGAWPEDAAGIEDLAIAAGEHLGIDPDFDTEQRVDADAVAAVAVDVAVPAGGKRPSAVAAS